MLLEGLKENKNNKVVHFICRNSKSVLLILIEKISNVKIQHNERGKKVSELTKDLFVD